MEKQQLPELRSEKKSDWDMCPSWLRTALHACLLQSVIDSCPFPQKESNFQIKFMAVPAWGTLIPVLS